MSSAENRIREDLKVAVRERDTATSTVLRGLLAAIKNRGIEKKGEPLSDADLVAVVKREAKQCGETLDFARKAGREESVREHEAALAVLARYLPAQMSEAELSGEIDRIVADLGHGANIGDVMKRLAAAHSGAYDGKTASRLAAAALGAKGR